MKVTVHPVGERLDALMTVLMAYIKDVCHVNGRQITSRKDAALAKDFYFRGVKE